MGRVFSILFVYGLILLNERYWFVFFVVGSKGYLIWVEEKVNLRVYFFFLLVGGFLGVFFGVVVELLFIVFLV